MQVRLWQQVSRQPVAPLDDPSFGSGGPLDSEIIARARHLKSSLFNGAVQAIAPLYVSSICKERCTYCNYRAGSHDPSLRRTRLSLDEIRREVEFLVDSRPLRAVELVYASDPQITPSDICRHVERSRSILEKHGASTVGLSAEPMSVADYRRLRDAGLWHTRRNSIAARLDGAA
jgi:2-iminoacetate synthase